MSGFVVAEDNALKTKLQGLVVSDEKNNSRTVEVWFANPDIEERKQSYPYITVELIDINWAAYRQHSGIWVDNDFQGTIAPVAGMAYSYEIPVAYDLLYQITTYSRHPRHDRAIIAHLMTQVFRANRGVLAVPNALGTETSYRHMVLEEFTKRDTIEDGRRLLRNVFTASVSSESSNPSLAPTTEVQEVLVNTDTSHIPSGLVPVD